MKEQLTPEDYNNLPQYIADRYHNRIPSFHSKYKFIKELTVARQIEETFEKELFERAETVLSEIVIYDNRKQQKERIKNILFSAFHSDFFHSKDIFSKLIDGSFLTSADYEDIKQDYVYGWFDDIIGTTDENFPDEEQLAAIAADTKNVEVVARAGSGKTSTIANRARFLLQHCHIPASSVLMLAFNKEAAAEMGKRLRTMIPDATTALPHIMTIHALAYSLVRPEEKLIYDDDRTKNTTLSDTIEEIIYDKLQDEKYYSKIKALMIQYFRDDIEYIESEKLFLSKDAYVQYRRSLPHRSLKGDYVKSFGEKMIADLLFENQITYQYEKAYTIEDGTIYKPDFSVRSEQDNFTYIIEYFGMAGDPKYDENTAVKKNHWKNQNKFKLISIYKEDILKGKEALQDLLEKEFFSPYIVFKPLTDDELWEFLKESSKLAFTETIKSFIGRCRKERLSPSEVKKKCKAYKTDIPEEKEFLDIGCDIYTDYIKLITERNQLDFDGLLDQAISKVSSGETYFNRKHQAGDFRGIKHILIDEYQDFSYLFDEFLTAIRQQCPEASIFCVGDDWQAINAFAGSDVYYFNQFLQRYKDSRKYPISTNYRSVPCIVDTSTSLMSSNNSEKIHAYNKGKGQVKTCFLDVLRTKLTERELLKTDIVTAAVLRIVQSEIYESGHRVVILSRTNNSLPGGIYIEGDYKGTALDKFGEYIKSFFPFDKDRISVSTTHTYKGKQNDAVIILDATSRYYPLIHPSWIFTRVFGDTVEKIIEDEKRLFYVALTRAKNNLYILSNQSDQSPFLEIIRTDNHAEDIDWDNYPPFPAPEDMMWMEVTNEFKQRSSSTYNIKEQLKLDGYHYDGVKQSWIHGFKKDYFDLEIELSKPWVNNADHVVVKLIDCDENVTRELRIVQSGDKTIIEDYESQNLLSLDSISFFAGLNE